MKGGRTVLPSTREMVTRLGMSEEQMVKIREALAPIVATTAPKITGII